VTPVGAFAAFLLGEPHIWHVREFGREDYDLAFDFGEKWSLRLMEKLSFRIIVISEALRQKYMRYISPHKAQTVYNAVNLGKTRPCGMRGRQDGAARKKIPILVIAGLLHEGKGQLDAVLAVGELLRRNVEVKLKIVGDGDRRYLERLKRTVAQNGIERYVDFMGFVDDIAPVMGSADAVLVCSRSEAFGRVTVEGMLCGKPVIKLRRHIGYLKILIIGSLY